MIHTLTGRENNEITFEIDFSAEEFEEAIEKTYKAQKSRYIVDGFRKGKVPRRIIESKFGEGVFFDGALDELFRTAYPDAIKSLKIKPVDSPAVDIKDEILKSGSGFVAIVKVTVEPECDPKDYKGVEVAKVSMEVGDEDVERDIELLRKRNSRLISVDREAAEGDTVYIDYKGFADGEQFEGGTAENQTLVLGSGAFIPGFEEQLVGHKAGDSVEVKVTFPEDYHADALAGKDAIFDCKLLEVKEEELPDLDDEFAKDVSEFDTLDELRKDIRERLEKTAAEQSEFQMKNALMEKVYDANEVDIPKVMIEDEAENMLREFSQQITYQGLNLEMYCKYTEKTVPELREEFFPDAEKKVKARLIIEAIADAEGITASEEEMEEEVSAMAKQYGMETEKLKSLLGEGSDSKLSQDIKIRKAVDFVYENAVFTEAKSSEGK